MVYIRVPLEVSGGRKIKKNQVKIRIIIYKDIDDYKEHHVAMTKLMI